MKVRLVGYGKTIPDGRYGNDKYYLEAELEEDEKDPHAALQSLKEIISAEDRRTVEVVKLQETITRLTNELYAIKARGRRFRKEWEKAETQWNRLVSLLSNHGVVVNDTIPKRPDFSWADDYESFQNKPELQDDKEDEPEL